jgi:flagellar basal-body rod protein FlgG
MIRGIYISGTSLVTNNRRIDAIGNNIANINTTGFKRDDVVTESFNAVLMAKFNGSRYTTEGPASTIEFEKTDDNYEASTENGFFRISTSTGVSHNKSVKFTVDNEGYLSTYYLNSDNSKNWNLGDRLLGVSGKPIQVGADENYELSETGEVLVNGTAVDSLVSSANRDVIGTLTAGVKLNRVFTDFTQGQMVRTDRELDFALEGDGFFTLDTPYGELLTRDGHFRINGDGTLVSSEGYAVQGFDGDIVLDSTDVAVNEFGEIIQGNEIVDKFQLKDVSNKGDLDKVGGNTYRIKADPVGEEIAFEGEVHQYFEEQSNADSITEMINMMTLQRNYEASQRVVLTHDNILDKAVNEIGRVG